jgi:endonuclease/exonuclease/phosphatase family metal-dependent hydrolase
VTAFVVASLNLHAGIDGWGRPFDVAGACRALEADVIVLQEDWSPERDEAQSDAAAGELGCSVQRLRLARGHIFGPPARASEAWGPRPLSRKVSPSLLLDRAETARGEAARRPRDREAWRGTWGLTVLSRLPVVSREEIDLGKLQRDPARRAALVLGLEAPGGPVTLVATHLSHVTQGSPLQLARLRRRLPPANSPAALVGDMNLWGPPVSAVLPGWRRAVRGRTWPSRRPLAQLDHIFVTGALGAEQGEVLGPSGSDHRPVRARLTTLR